MKNKKFSLWYLINAKNKTIGYILTYIIQNILKKFKNITKYKFWKIYIIIKNINYIKFTGKKLEKNFYYRHTKYPGGLKKIKLKNIFINNPQNLLIKSIKNMLAKNKINNKIKNFIKVFKNINNKYINKKLKIINI